MAGAVHQQTVRQQTARHSAGQASGHVEANLLYTAAEKARRDASGWTLVQGILAPTQFIVFLVSLALVVRTLMTGEGFYLASASVILKTGVLYLIMITGAIWEKEVFGQYLFAPPFFWEDVVSMGVIALHTVYVGAFVFGFGDPATQMWIALAAYAAYVVNAAQFVWKLRRARLQSAALDGPRHDRSDTPTAMAAGAAS
ncbi:MAG: 2-vinyl bacteriochlorophyllide hydratase [Pseudomonadota bacterium]